MPEEQIVWRRAQSCQTGNCVEVARVGDTYAVRRSSDPDGPRLHFSEAEWLAFVLGVREGDFD
jgi:hypothetical protein